VTLMTMRINRWCMAIASVTLLAATMACAASARQRPISKGPVDTGAGSLTAARQYLEGRWILESFVIHPLGGTPLTLKGTGVLNYDDFGNLRMDIKTDEASADLLRASGIIIPDGVISTTGRTVIDMQNHTLTYVLDGQPPSMRTGGGPLATNRPRHWEVAADVLTLTTRDDGGAPLSISRWKKSS
jgi:hypothetical protein